MLSDGTKARTRQDVKKDDDGWKSINHHRQSISQRTAGMNESKREKKQEGTRVIEVNGGRTIDSSGGWWKTTIDIILAVCLQAAGWEI